MKINSFQSISNNCKFWTLVLALLVIPTISFSADKNADPDAGKPMGTIVETSDGLPCLKVSVACKKFVKESKPDDKSLTTQSCVDDLIVGKTVAGLKVDQAVLEQCKKVRNQLRTR